MGALDSALASAELNTVASVNNDDTDVGLQKMGVMNHGFVDDDNGAEEWVTIRSMPSHCGDRSKSTLARITLKFHSAHFFECVSAKQAKPTSSVSLATSITFNKVTFPRLA